jgi:hypothetical protein
MPFDTPVVVCVFNRPDHTLQLLHAIAGVEPRQLMVIADGPRDHVTGDREKCESVRQIVERGITWPCSVSWNASSTNLGCRKRLQSGFDWVFSQVERAIILEDDCIPDITFFAYCAELLERYRDNPEVGIISGFNPLAQSATAFAGEHSYFFSRYPQIWGLATWRRMWQHYDPDVVEWDRLRDTDWLQNLLGNPLAASYWRAIFNRAAEGFDTWDYSLSFSLWRREALSIVPSVNTVWNLGFGPDATHTTNRDARSDLKSSSLCFPLVHAPGVIRNEAFDKEYESEHCSGSIQDLLKALRTSLRSRAASS